MIDYKKLYSELGGVGNVSPELAYEARGLERAKGSLFDSSHPLAFDNAQNTAQMAKDKSDELQEAFKAASAGDFEKMPKFPAGFERNPMYNPSATGINAPSMFAPTQGQYTPNRRIFAGGFYNTDPYGNLKNEQYEMARTGVMFGMPGAGGGGYRLSEDQMKRQQQTPTSNIAPYGFDEHGNRIVQSNLEPMPSEGLLVSKYQKK